MVRSQKWSVIVTLLAGAATPIVVHAEPIVGITAGAQAILTFDSATPGTTISNAPITGLQAQETIIAIDRRPSNGSIYGLSSNNRIYTLDATAGTATFVSTLSQSNIGAGGSTGFDFNPVADPEAPSLRVAGGLLTGTTLQNTRVDVDTGAVTVDVPFAFAPGDPNASLTPNLPGLAYSNNTADATSTTLYGLSSLPGSSINPPVLVTISSPTDGTITTVGSLDLFNLNAIQGFDISGATGTAFAAIGTPSGSQLFTIDLGTGSASLIGTISAGAPLLGITVGVGGTTPPPPPPNGVPEPSTLLLLGAGLVGIGSAMRRRKGGGGTAGAV